MASALLSPWRTKPNVNGELQFEETETPEETKPEKPKLRNKFLEGLGRKITNMFGNSEDDSDLI